MKRSLHVSSCPPVQTTRFHKQLDASLETLMLSDFLNNCCGAKQVLSELSDTNQLPLFHSSLAVRKQGWSVVSSTGLHFHNFEIFNCGIFVTSTFCELWWFFFTLVHTDTNRICGRSKISGQLEKTIPLNLVKIHGTQRINPNSLNDSFQMDSCEILFFFHTPVRFLIKK